MGQYTSLNQLKWMFVQPFTRGMPLYVTYNGHLAPKSEIRTYGYHKWLEGMTRQEVKNVWIVDGQSTTISKLR